ncbi:MAG: 50S ribosomal protein L24 [Candidatus Omnitrophica bacterium]|nr:50S ribosomal protein L24 [Candidatus Omnitrophota bacterium]
MKIKKDDQVLVIQGKDKGKKGRVMKVYPKVSRLLVEKINYRKKAMRRSQQNPQGGIVQMEGMLPSANVQLICPRCSQPTRVAYSVLADGTKQRSCKKCSELI